MNKTSKNMVFQMLYQMFIIIVPLIVTPYITRIFGAELYGRYTYALTMCNYFGLFCILGITYHGNRSIAYVAGDKDKLSETFCSIYSIQLFASLLTLCIYLLYFVFVSRDTMTLIMMINLVSTALDISWFFFGIEDIKKIVFRNVIIKILSTFLIFALIKNSNQLVTYAAIICLSNLASQLVLWLSLPRRIHFTKVKKDEIKTSIKPILLLFVPVIATSIYKMMDKIMIGNLSSMYYVGIYEAAEKIVNIPLSFITAIGTVMLPRISNVIANENRRNINGYSFYTMQLSIFISSAMCFGIISIRNYFVSFYFGNEFGPVADVLAILSFVTLILGWQQIVRTHFITPLKKDKEFTITLILGAIINLVLNYILIPILNANGAAIATLCTEFFVMVLTTYYSKKKFNIVKHAKVSIPYVLVGMMMYVFIDILNKEFLSDNSIISVLVLDILLGGLTYLLLSVIYIWFFNSETKDRVKKVIYGKHKK